MLIKHLDPERCKILRLIIKTPPYTASYGDHTKFALDGCFELFQRKTLYKYLILLLRMSTGSEHNNNVLYMLIYQSDALKCI